MSALPFANFFSTRHPSIVGEYRRTFTIQQHSSIPISRAGRNQRLQWLSDLQNPHWLLDTIKEHESLWMNPSDPDKQTANLLLLASLCGLLPCPSPFLVSFFSFL